MNRGEEEEEGKEDILALRMPRKRKERKKLIGGNFEIRDVGFGDLNAT